MYFSDDGQVYMQRQILQIADAASVCELTVATVPMAT